MENKQIILRELTDQDGPSLAGLSFYNQGEGLIRFSSCYKIDPIQAIRAMNGDVHGVVACNGAHILGVGLVRFGTCRLADQERPFAFLGDLFVHPEFRRQGLATQITRWRITHAHHQLGEQVLLLANIQRGNPASLRSVQQWAHEISSPLIRLPLRMRDDPPALLPGLTVREAEPGEIPEFIEGLTDSNHDYNLFQPLTLDQLTAQVQHSPLPVPIRHLYVAVDRSGRITAGLVALDEFRLKQMNIRIVPAPLRLLSDLMHLTLPSGTVRQVSLDRLWYRPGQATAARCLIETLRWQYREEASNLSIGFDPRSRIADLFTLRPWSMLAHSHLAIGKSGQFNPARPICSIS